MPADIMRLYVSIANCNLPAFAKITSLTIIILNSELVLMELLAS